MREYRRTEKSLQRGFSHVVIDDMRTAGLSALAASDIGVPLPPLEDFFALFKDDNDCLEFLWRSRFSVDGRSAHCPECGQTREFQADVDTTAHLRWRCVSCGYYLSPIAGTIFQGSQTPLHLYFDAIGTLGEPGRSAPIEELAYELGITFATATEVTRLLAGRFDSRDSSSPRFEFDLVTAIELTFNNEATKLELSQRDSLRGASRT